MLNVIRADFYRIFIQRGIYLALGFTLLTMLVVVLLVGNGTIDIPFFLMYLGTEVNGKNAASLLMANGTIFTLIVVPVFTVAAADIFVEKVSKNEVSWGFSRVKLYLARMILSSILIAGIYLLYIISGMIVATAIGGLGGSITLGFVLDVLASLGLQLLLLSAAAWIGILLYFIIRHEYVVTILYMSVLVFISMVIGAVVQTDPSLYWVMGIDIGLNIHRIGLMPLNQEAVIPAVLLAAFWLSVTGTLGILLFRKAEIK